MRRFLFAVTCLGLGACGTESAPSAARAPEIPSVRCDMGSFYPNLDYPQLWVDDYAAAVQSECQSPLIKAAIPFPPLTNLTHHQAYVFFSGGMWYAVDREWCITPPEPTSAFQHTPRPCP